MPEPLRRALLLAVDVGEVGPAFMHFFKFHGVEVASGTGVGVFHRACQDQTLQQEQESER